EVAAAAVVGSVRRVVVSSAGVVIDLGRRVRLFQGSSRLAVLLQSHTCIWPGCNVPASRCQADHTEPFSAGGARGSTSPGNGAPLCGKHNRLKNHGFTTWRDPAGQWHTYRPDGTEI